MVSPTPTTSGTTAYNPSAGEFIQYAYGLCGVRRTAITAEHMTDARIAINLLMAEWNNDTPNLWKVTLTPITLVQGTAIYTVPSNIIMVLDAYIRTTDSSGATTDLTISPLSRTEYSSLPQKATQSRPTSFWFDRLITPSLYLWPTPDGNGPYTLNYYGVGQIQDVNLPSGALVDLPNRWFSALAFGLGAKLAHSYAPQHVERLEMKAAKTLQQAQDQDVENVPLFIGPGTGGYFVR